MGKIPTHSVCFQLVVRTLSMYVTAATTTSTSASTVIRMTFHTLRVSGLQSSAGPGACIERKVAVRLQGASPARAIVNTRVAFDPELDRVGPQSIAAPVRRTRHLRLFSSSPVPDTSVHTKALRDVCNGIDENLM